MAARDQFYGLATFPTGTTVRISAHAILEEFSLTWRLHHPLGPEQIKHAGGLAKVAKVMMYHGGDILYELENVPGVWHQHLLKAVES